MSEVLQPHVSPKPKSAKNYDRIWLQPLCNVDQRCWSEMPQDCDECGSKSVEYVRLDVAIAGGYREEKQ